LLSPARKGSASAPSGRRSRSGGIRGAGREAHKCRGSAPFHRRDAGASCICARRFLVVPSRAESLPYVILEAAAAGVPLIASNVGGIPEILGPDAVDLVPPGDPAALARAIAQSLRNPERKDAAVSRLQARVRSMFSAEVMTDAILDAYKTVMARRHG
jgi:glycosyltransferase involved in cell wall biosynthesis